jgi:hypothetical protein
MFQIRLAAHGGSFSRLSGWARAWSWFVPCRAVFLVGRFAAGEFFLRDAKQTIQNLLKAMASPRAFVVFCFALA